MVVGFDDGTLSVVRPSVDVGSASSTQPIPAMPSGATAAIAVLSFAPGSGATGGLLAIGSHDRTVRVLELVADTATQRGGRLKLVPRCCCSGHTGTVTHLDWSADATLLMTNDTAHEILVWSMPAGKRVAHAVRAVATVHWATWTCVLGFPCMGIFPEGANTTLVNSCHISGDGSALLTADDDGALKLFNAPCVVEGAPYTEGTGHCAGITCARFLRGDQTAVSSGGVDRSVMLWRVARGAPPSQGRAVAALPEMVARQCMLQPPLKGID